MDTDEKRDFKKLTKPDLIVELEQLYEENKRLKKTHQDLDRQHTLLQTETTTIRNQYTDSTKSNTDLKAKLKQEREIKNTSIQELTLTQAKLSDSRKLNAEFVAKLATIDCDGSPSTDNVRPKVLIALDDTSSEIMKHLNKSEINFVNPKDVHSVDDLVKSIHDDTFIDSLLQYHKLIICLGNKDIAEGVLSDTLYKNLHRSLVALQDKVDIEVLLVQIPPNGNKLFHVSVYNAKMSNQKMAKVTTALAIDLEDYSNEQILDSGQITLLPWNPHIFVT